jgi:uncharacterized protein YqhQ
MTVGPEKEGGSRGKHGFPRGSEGSEPKASDPLRLGGMALRNGLLIHGPTAWAVAARAPDGRIEVASGQKPVLARGRLGRVPLVRGPLRLAEAFAVIPIARRRLPSARLPFEDARVLGSAAAAATLTATLRRLGPTTIGREAVASMLGLLPALAALRDRELARYHGVEHKAIGAYERGSSDPATAPKEHDRCGSNLIAPLLLLSAAGQVVVDRLVERPTPGARAAAGLGSVSGAVELFAYADRRPNSPLGRAIHATGREIQRLVSTREPTPEQLEVGRLALAEILRAEGEQPPETSQ